MSSQFFRVEEYVIDCQHIREYPGATSASQEDVLQLAVKHYTPLDNPNPRPGDITIIGAHANGFPKELYEPLWEEILKRSQKNGFRIRSIWIADAAHQGQSGVLNEAKIADDPSWMDHPRDLLHMINHFRGQMSRPLVGIGHSMGGCHLALLSLMHPRLFTTLVLMDPVIQEFATSPVPPSPVEQSTFRRDLWPSIKAAEDSFRKNRVFQKWDSRVMDRWIQYGFREVPTPIYDKDSGVPAGAVTLKTTKHQEVFTFLRPNYDGETPGGDKVINRDTHADLDPEAPATAPFYRPEPVIMFRQLPHLRPSVFYIFGETSDLSRDEFREQKMELTGVGVGGSGGVIAGRVKNVVLEGIGHLIPMEAVEAAADHASSWVGAEIARWNALEQKFNADWSKRSPKDMTMISEAWKTHIRGSKI